MRHLSKNVIEELGRRLNVPVLDTKAPMKRCIVMLKNGEVDLMVYAHNTYERAKHMDFMHSTDGEIVVFMVRKKDGDGL
jgi:hypothetical protein